MRQILPKTPTIAAFRWGRSTESFYFLLLALATCGASTFQPTREPTPADPPTPANVSTTWPPCVFAAYPTLEPYRDDEYFVRYATDSISRTPPEQLFEYLSTAEKSGEHYKALYFARLLTAAMPRSSAAWENRAAIADELGLSSESRGSRARAADPSSTVTPSLDLLPGFALRRPSTLADWAAALNLMADDVLSTNGAEGSLAVKDNLGGQEVNHHDGLDGDEVYITTKPIELETILPNTFVLRDARPMVYSSVNTSTFVAGALLGAIAGVNSYYGDTSAAARNQERAGEAMAQAYSVPSKFSKGSYTARRYQNSQPIDSAEQPRPAGKLEAVELPLTLFAAAGGSTSATTRARLIDSKLRPAKFEDCRLALSATSDPGYSKRDCGEYRPTGELAVPRVVGLASESQGAVATLLDLMANPKWRDSPLWKAYERRASILFLTNVVAYDQKYCYKGFLSPVYHPASWFIASPHD